MKPGLRVLFFLPSINAYRDRVETLMQVSRSVDQYILLIGNNDHPVSYDEYPNFRIVDCRFKKGWGPFNSIKASCIARRIITEESVDIVHDTFAVLLPLFLRRSRYPNVRFVTSIYGELGWRLNHVWAHIPMHQHIRSKTSLTLFKDRLAEKCVLASVDCAVVQAPGLVSRMGEFNRVKRKNISVVTNSVNEKRWCPAGNGLGRTRPVSPVRLLAGSTAFTRGAGVMFEALRTLKERNVPALLTMAGGPQWERFSGRYLESLLDQGDLRKSVKRVGRLSSDELLLAFHSHDLFLYQTMNDGSPRIVLEAMASGIPIIASHHPGIDVLDPGQKAIGFTEYGDAAKIADLIEDYMSNHVPWWERAAEGRRIVETRFTKVVGAAQYVDLYDRLLSGKGVTFAKQHSSR